MEEQLQRRSCDVNGLCTPLAVLKENVDNLHDSVTDIKRCEEEYFMKTDLAIEHQKNESAKIYAELQKITNKLERQKSFYAGVVFAVTGIVGFVMYFFKEIMPHVKL